MAPTLPAEVWSGIVTSLPRDEQIVFLNVSKAFHKIAFRRVFKAIRLYFLSEDDIPSLPEPPENEDGEEPELMCDDPEALCETLRDRTREILDRIIEDPEFAVVVKELGVVGSAHADPDADVEDESDDGDDEAEDEFDEGKELRKKFKEAIKALSSLKRVTWWGENPSFASFAPLLPPDLEVLNLNVSIPSMIGGVKAFNGVQELQYINPLRESGYPQLSHAPDSSNDQSLKLLVAELAPRLRRLALPYYAVDQLFTANLDKLVNLEIYATQRSDMQGLNRLWPCLPNLQELSLLGNIGGEAIRELPLDPNSLRHLHSFRFSHAVVLEGEDDATHLAQFLDQRPGLERLLLDFGMSEIAENLGPLLPAFSNLENLEALGIIFDGSMNRDELEMLSASLPNKKLQALHFQVDWSNFTDEHVGLPLMFIRYMDHLSYLYFGGFQCGDEILADYQTLAHSGKKIQLVGECNCLWNVSRSGRKVETTRRPAWQTEFPLEGDFANPNHSWLFRYSRR
ncbi:hypothetical protein BDN72DRAFT_833138 [Pluteus cervinus]|uniref:Uncharacterized protein n=1 Tax=Pluteus cervinus TaxID=181527 RepID=A0ACD3BAF0_9AGAR|nr:hypothetical protein BDN72DRAFT_833138 [Pluteus cervinus]